jgi:hypothetical protein
VLGTGGVHFGPFTPERLPLPPPGSPGTSPSRPPSKPASAARHLFLFCVCLIFFPIYRPFVVRDYFDVVVSALDLVTRCLGLVSVCALRVGHFILVPY